MAALLLLAACPSGGGTTSDDTGTTESGSTTDTTGSSAEETNSDPTTNTTPPTTNDTEPTGGSMSGTESNSGTESTTEENPTTGTNPGECAESKDCDAAAPFCENSKCVTCSETAMPDVSCAGVSGDTPVCSEGACVECTPESASACSGTTPVCGEGNACTGCTQHSECGDSACNLESGACFAPEYVLYVDRAATCDGGLGTMDAPFCKIGDALAHVGMDDVTLGWTIKIKGGNYLEDPLVVPDGATLVLTRWGDASPKIRATDDSGPTLTIANASKVYVDRLQFNSNDSSHAVVCANASAWIDDARMAGNQGQGYEGTECTSYINRSVIYQNVGGGVAAYGGVTHIHNTYVTANGSPDFSEFGGVRSAQGNELHLIYSTVAINLAASGPRTLQCADAGTGEIRNSVLIGYGTPSIDCMTGTFTTSAIDEGAVDGDGNYAAVQADIMTFFDAPAAGVFAAKAGTPIENLAVWKDGDPKTDFNGTPRPNMDGATDFAGADNP